MAENAETPELTEDEQFAAAVKDNPLFAGNDPPADDEPQEEPDGTLVVPESALIEEPDAPAASTEPAPAATDGADLNPNAPDADAGAEPAAAGAVTDASATPTSDEPFPGYAALAPEAREAFDKLVGERHKYQNDYNALHGMTAPLQRQNAELRRQHDAQVARIQQLEQLERKQQDVSAAKDRQLQEYEDWAKQFPEESRAVSAMVNPLREKVTALEGSLNAARAELGTLHAERQQAALAREIGELEHAHPDWRQIHDNPEYWEWLGQQTPGIQGLNSSMFAGDTIQLLNLFKTAHAPAPAPTAKPTPPAPSNADRIQQRRSQALARGTSPTVRSAESPVNTVGNQPAMSDEDAEFARLVADNPNFR